MPTAGVNVEKIGDHAIGQAIDQVAECAANDRTIPRPLEYPPGPPSR